MKKTIILVLVLISIIHKLYTVPAYPFPIDILQPDGTTLTIQLYGDESYKIRTTLDGYVISIDENGFYTYKVEDENRSVIQEKIIARNIEDRSESDRIHLKNAIKLDDFLTKQVKEKAFKIKRAPQKKESNGFLTIGSPRSLVILVNFQDKDFITNNPADSFTRLLNQENYSDNGATGSARDYFRASSYGEFNPQFDVVGPFTLPNNMSFYGKNDKQGEDENPVQMIVDACNLAYQNGVDFSLYDIDNDGYIDNVFVYYAGHNEAEGALESTIWPHRWVVYPGHNYSGSNASITFNGVKIFDYACTSELKGKIGANMCGIGTFCHEFGHVLGLPDYYHTEEHKTTLQFWSIMDAGSYSNEGRTPPTFSAYDRFFLGWLTPEELTESAEKELEPLSQIKTIGQNTEKQAYLLSETPHNMQGYNPSPNEFFIMEYRKKTGWDTFLPAEGLLFWHIDYDEFEWGENEVNNYSGNHQTKNSHMRVYLQPLNGSSTTPGTAFPSGSFTPTTWSGQNINRRIFDITKTSEKITFQIDVVDFDILYRPRILANIVQDTLQFPQMTINEQFVKHLRLSSVYLTEDLSLSVEGEDAGSFSISENVIGKESATSVTGAEIYIIFKPKVAKKFNATLKISEGGMDSARLIQLQATVVK